jgi:hypothetical protein
MLGDWLSDLFGKPQSWYDQIDTDQKALAVRAAQINSIGSDVWGTVRDAYLASTQGPDVDFLAFDDINNGIGSALKSLIITSSHTPSDQDIAAAESYNAQYGHYVDYVTQMAPQVAAQAAADAANVTAMLSQNSLKSPAVAGAQAFEDEVARRAAILGAGLGAGMLLYLAIPFALAALFSGRGK